MFHREIIGYSARPNKTAKLVQQAFHKITRPLNKITLFHTDRGNEFKNKIIDEILSTFKISSMILFYLKVHINMVQLIVTHPLRNNNNSGAWNDRNCWQCPKKNRTIFYETRKTSNKSLFSRS
ncbi:hypothetical protein [Spiroplasma endosymbiont of 'Nebria riversi']|uniref:hypothetical protein n=1 Tax=Spiroplasma endosymbiont of 'Nebria riversi' TaxID=2792084 RepID=UPI001C03DE3F